MTQTAMQQLQRRPLTPEQYARAMRDYHTAAAPITRAMCRLVELQPFRLTMTEGGPVEREILWLPGAKETCDRYQELMAYTRRLALGTGGGEPPTKEVWP